MPSITKYFKCNLSFTVFIAMLFSLGACKNRVNSDTGKSKKQNNTTVSLINAKKKTELDTAGYKVFQTISPQMSSGGKQIIISILQDARLEGPTSEIHYYPLYHAAQLLFTSDGEILNPDGPNYKPAMVQVRHDDGTFISQSILDVPSARIDTVYLDEDKKHVGYLFTKDYSIGWGSYNGPATYFVYFTDTGIVNYKGDNGFAITLKSAWAIRYTDNHLEVWSKLCRPADSMTTYDDFNIITRKTVLGIGSFKSITILKKGFWEDEGDTSAESLKDFFDSFSQ